MKIKGFKDCSDPVWNVYEKQYGHFSVVASHHKNEEPGKYEVSIIEADNLGYHEIEIAEGVDESWLKKLDILLANK